MPRFCFVALLALCLGSTAAMSQTVRFETSVGDFDMVLNPNDDANLQPLVDNLIAYVGLGRYHFSAINRAADNNNTDPSDDFVLQMGGFMGFPPTPDLWAQMFGPVESFDPVVTDANGDGQVDFDTITNSRGTVSLALSALGPNSGTSSFFINLGSNDFLDSQGFVPFAEIDNMDTVDRIMSLMQRDLSGGNPSNLALTDVPLTENERIVVVNRAFVVEADEDFSFVGPIATALQLATRGSAASTSTSTASGFSSGASSTPSLAGLESSSPPIPPASLGSTAIPEPGTAMLLVPLALWAISRRRK